MSMKERHYFKKRRVGDSFKPFAIVHKTKKGMPTVIEIEKRRYILDAESARKSL